MGVRQEVEALFFGSGVQELYKHWHPPFKGAPDTFQRFGEWEAGQAPDIWAYRVTATNPLNTEELLDKVITYSVIYTAVELISDEKADEQKPFHPVSPETGRACSNLVYTDSLDGLDPHTIDEVLQVAVYGGVWHPHFEPRKNKS